MQDYQRLDVWKRAHQHALHVRRATERFPKIGYASLKSQVTSAAESIPFNIVEGCGAESRKELARFLTISIKSSSELQYQLFLTRGYGVLDADSWEKLTDETIEIRRMLCGLRKKVLGPPDK